MMRKPAVFQGGNRLGDKHEYYGHRDRNSHRLSSGHDGYQSPRVRAQGRLLGVHVSVAVACELRF